MKIVNVFIYFLLSTLLLQAQTEIRLFNVVEMNEMLYEITLLNGTHIRKHAGERWNVELQDKKFNVKSANRDSMIVVVSFIDGSTIYSFDKHSWHQKSYLEHDVTKQSVKNKLTTMYDEQSNEVNIEFYSETESNTKFYLMPYLGNSRILLGNTLVNNGYNSTSFTIKHLKRGKYFLIVDSDNHTSISSVFIF